MSRFNEQIERRNTDSMKWKKYAGTDILPMWVADMDFKAPTEVLDALKERVEHGVFGYAKPSEELNNTVVKHLKKHYNWDIKKEWLVWLTGVVPGLNVASRAVGERGDGVITQVPIYPYFMSAPEAAEREVQKLPLKDIAGRWSVDFDALEQLIHARTKLFLLCNPQNPGGTVFTREELQRLADICNKHAIVICSDEIHCDLILDENTPHIPIASLDEATAQNSITLMAASKTFNIAGLATSFAVIPNRRLRVAFEREKGSITGDINVLGYLATEVALKEGELWRQELLAYLRNNLKLLQNELKEIPKLKLLKQEATYLAWIDASALGLENPTAFFEEHGVGFSDGTPFGNKQYIRMNFACHENTLKEALKRVKNAIKSL